jgi:CDP-glucose 4,6-dehydratase
MTREAQPHEAQLLHLDSSKARARLNWQPVWTLEQCLVATADWYRALAEDQTVRSGAQLAQFVADAGRAGLPWCQT